MEERRGTRLKSSPMRKSPPFQTGTTLVTTSNQDGYKNSPGQFTAHVTSILHDIDPEALSYVDDIYLMDDELLQHLRRVARIVVGFVEFGYKLNFKKTKIAFLNVLFLGYELLKILKVTPSNTDLCRGKVVDLKETLPNVHVVHTLGHQRVGIHVAGNRQADEAAKSAVVTAAVAAVTRSGTKLDDDIWAAVKATAEGTPFPKAFPAKYSYRKGGFLDAEVKISGVGVRVIPNKDPRLELIKAAHEGVSSTHADVCCLHRIKDVPITPTGWIPKVGDLVREKVAVKKEFGPSYRAPVPVLGIHGTRTVILLLLAGAKENRFVSIDNVKLHHVTDPTQQTKRRYQ
ncbi:hypothetical protein NDU88_005417 [Pleurodeles waltl]|uniref:ribonuclease H n=1 Tax=Pleurodeles waltl TaxID=8319 RepID=A0AAV7RM66_PLEWA|nr:hypothetical protein NDU88_005417 [Pleurodeles waltl]